jgi:hypothetical protein
VLQLGRDSDWVRPSYKSNTAAYGSVLCAVNLSNTANYKLSHCWKAYVMLSVPVRKVMPSFYRFL